MLRGKDAESGPCNWVASVNFDRVARNVVGKRGSRERIKKEEIRKTVKERWNERGRRNVETSD